jgi:alpha-glucoside transport system substrate-binding protein
MAHMTSPEFEFADLAASSWISPHKTFDVSKYPDETTKTVAGIAYESTVFRFDGSDQMPGAVGAGTFWKGMTAWISGQQDLNEALTSIEESWPT